MEKDGAQVSRSVENDAEIVLAPSTAAAVEVNIDLESGPRGQSSIFTLEVLHVGNRLTHVEVKQRQDIRFLVPLS
jgi:hypothetical protein